MMTNFKLLQFFLLSLQGGIRLKNDPKQILESLRIDEEDPLLHHRPRKFRKPKNEWSQASNATIISLCLVTGLSTGVGSALANTLEDQSIDHLPLDVPPSKVQLNTNANVELPRVQVPQTESKELAPNRPPLDEPATNVIKQPKHNDNVQTGKAHIKDIKKSKESTNHSKETNENHPTTSDEKLTKQQEIAKVPSVHHETKQTQEKKETQARKHQTTSTVNMKQEQKHNETQVGTPSKDVISLKPKTENGGVLPDTAGNDLNDVVLGAGVALVGSLLLKRKRAKPE
jgi:hypothetical protein